MEWSKVKRRFFFYISHLSRVFFLARRGGKETEDGGLDSKYFSIIPNRVKATNIYDLLMCNGDIVEVNIAPYRNKISKRYGFVDITRLKM